MRTDKAQFLGDLRSGRRESTPERLALANHIVNNPECECEVCGVAEPAPLDENMQAASPAPIPTPEPTPEPTPGKIEPAPPEVPQPGKK